MSQYFCNYLPDLLGLLPLEQAQVTPNKKSTQITQPAFPSKGKNQKEEGIQP